MGGEVSDLTTKEVVTRLRYQGEQYSNGQFSRGGGMHKHYLIQAAEIIEQLEAQLAKARSDALEEAAVICKTISYSIPIEEWHELTKKDHSLRACNECASAILAAKEKP